MSPPPPWDCIGTTYKAMVRGLQDFQPCWPRKSCIETRSNSRHEYGVSRAQRSPYICGNLVEVRGPKTAAVTDQSQVFHWAGVCTREDEEDVCGVYAWEGRKERRKNSGGSRPFKRRGESQDQCRLLPHLIFVTNSRAAGSSCGWHE